MAHRELVQGRSKFIIFIMVDDIQLDDLPEEMKGYAKTRTYIDAVNLKNQKHLELFRKKLQYAMPQTSLRHVPKPAANQEGRNPNFPPLFNRINRYTEYNRRMEMNIEEVEEEGNVQEVERETVL